MSHIEALNLKTELRIAIIGGRNFNDYDTFKKVIESIDAHISYQDKTVIVVSGGANGADTLGSKWALENNYGLMVFEADWKNLDTTPCRIKHGKYGPYNALAGFNRNDKIVENADIIIAFWDGNSPGTGDSIKKARKLNKPILIYDYINNVLNGV